jgi:methylase of polypeptide subunit release factors
VNDAALLALGRHLRRRSYRFVTPTPATIACVNRRIENRVAADLAGAFGWNRPFAETLLDAELFALLREGRLVSPLRDATGIAPLRDAAIAPHDGAWRSTVRASTLDDALYFHSAFPTEAADAVFFGPDSYRFARLIEHELGAHGPKPRRILDLGCGSGVGGLHAIRLLGGGELTLSDINPAALALARINAALADQNPRLIESDLYTALVGPFDLILANPPYMMDDKRRAYRDGGDRLGAALSLRIVAQSLAQLAPGGRLVLYTGSAISGGKDGFGTEIASLLNRENVRYAYREIDPDVFGDELDQPAYRDVERIAAVALTVTNTH